MKKIYADLHVHIGRAGGKAVKITASEQMTLEAVLHSTRTNKGLDMVGVVDCGSPLVLEEIKQMLDRGLLQMRRNQDLIGLNGVSLILGAEMESREGAHFITYLPDLQALETWQKIMRKKVSNLNLSTQKSAATAAELMDIALGLEGLFVVAHAFTPHKGAYGCWVKRLHEGFRGKETRIHGLELGLSADTAMAGLIGETGRFALLSNSDAHSLPYLAREYNQLRVESAGFHELKLALAGENGRMIIGNYGMDPRLGKYHRSYCIGCDWIADTPEPIFTCPACGKIMIPGVWDRIMTICDSGSAEKEEKIGRPPYHYRVPLSFIPGMGPKTLEKLRNALGTDIAISEEAEINAIKKVAGASIAAYIHAMRRGELLLQPGGGGKYGRVLKELPDWADDMKADQGGITIRVKS